MPFSVVTLDVKCKQTRNGRYQKLYQLLWFNSNIEQRYFHLCFYRNFNTFLMTFLYYLDIRVELMTFYMR